MSYEQQLQNLSGHYRIRVYFDGRAKRDGLAHILFFKYGMCLAEFHNLSDAVAWFPFFPSQLPGAASNRDLIHSAKVIIK